MNDLDAPPEKRKVLSLKKQPDTINAGGTPRHYVGQGQSIYMVYSASGHMPKRVYRSDEQTIALSHAKTLASEHGELFHVLRSWRAFEPAE